MVTRVYPLLQQLGRTTGGTTIGPSIDPSRYHFSSINWGLGCCGRAKPAHNIPFFLTLNQENKKKAQVIPITWATMVSAFCYGILIC
jgi:hypothetical protein